MKKEIVWIDPNKRLPPQGKKILWFKEGDCYVSYRLGKYWFPIPFTDSKFASLSPPQYWTEFPFPNQNYTGHFKIGISGRGELFEIDVLEKKYPRAYRNFLSTMLWAFKNSQWSNRKKTNTFANRTN